MSVCVETSSLSPDLLDQINTDLQVTPLEKKGFGGKVKGVPKGETVYPYRISDDDTKVYLPLRYGLSVVPDCSVPSRESFTELKGTFSSELRSVQKEVKDEAIQQLNKKKSCVISLYTGAGKSGLGVYLATRIKLRTLILCHRLILVEQWKSTIERFSPESSICVLNPSISKKKKQDTNCDFLIANAQNIPKFESSIIEKCGLVIVDEIHTFCTKSLIKALFYCCPRYMIGLSATPYRSDGMDKLLDFYFGEDKIIRKLNREHVVYQMETKIKLETKLTIDGKLDWNSVIDSQAFHPARNKLIVDTILNNQDRSILVLTKRIKQSELLAEALRQNGINVSLLTGGNNRVEDDARVVIATTQKCGVGFSHDSLDTLILASDSEEYFIQYLGRVFRTEVGVPVVYDFVDDLPTLKRHFATRKKVYMESGGKIVKKVCKV